MCTVNIEIQTFKYSKYVAIALSKVWGNKARIPSMPRLWEWNKQHVLEKGGYGKYFQFLGNDGLRGTIYRIHSTILQVLMLMK
jgi:hypothetical protein